MQLRRQIDAVQEALSVGAFAQTAIGGPISRISPRLASLY